MLVGNPSTRSSSHTKSITTGRKTSSLFSHGFLMPPKCPGDLHANKMLKFNVKAKSISSHQYFRYFVTNFRYSGIAATNPST